MGGLAALVSGHGELVQRCPGLARKQHLAAILLCGGEGERLSYQKRTYDSKQVLQLRMGNPATPTSA